MLLRLCVLKPVIIIVGTNSRTSHVHSMITTVHIQPTIIAQLWQAHSLVRNLVIIIIVGTC